DASQARGYAFLIETAYRVWRWDGRILEIPITFTDRVRGRSKMSVGVAAEQLWLVTRLGGRDLRWGRRRRAGRDRDHRRQLRLNAASNTRNIHSDRASSA